MSSCNCFMPYRDQGFPIHADWCDTRTKGDPMKTETSKSEEITKPAANRDELEVMHIFTYHAPTPDEVKRMEQIRLAARRLATVLVQNVPSCADRSAALRKLRECSMTANAAIVLNRKPEGAL